MKIRSGFVSNSSSSSFIITFTDKANSLCLACGVDIIDIFKKLTRFDSLDIYGYTDETYMQPLTEKINEDWLNEFEEWRGETEKLNRIKALIGDKNSYYLTLNYRDNTIKSLLDSLKYRGFVEVLSLGD